MRIFLFAFFLLTAQSYAQTEIESGTYGELRIAVNTFMKQITGYYENYSGWDENLKQPRFSCIFYFEGKIENGKSEIKTYYPLEKSNAILGQLQRVDSNTIQIKLSSDHGGCPNVQRFAEEHVILKMDKTENWMQIRFADLEKTYFHSTPTSTAKEKAFIVKGDIVYVDRIENTWAHCTYFGKKKKTGWISLEELNKLSNN